MRNKEINESVLKAEIGSSAKQYEKMGFNPNSSYSNKEKLEKCLIDFLVSTMSSTMSCDGIIYHLIPKLEDTVYHHIPS